ncbi:hypothetical protein TNCV_1730081 [Trichonephila clavipes]|nr:hypothetical protein TNCV_1730081 [Trichonephila clavipes]
MYLPIVKSNLGAPNLTLQGDPNVLRYATGDASHGTSKEETPPNNSKVDTAKFICSGNKERARFVVPEVLRIMSTIALAIHQTSSNQNTVKSGV